MWKFFWATVILIFASSFSNAQNAVHPVDRKLDALIESYTQSIQKDPKDAKAYAKRGQAYRDRGKSDLALADYAKAIELDPKDAKSYVRRGEIYRGSFKLDLAMSDYNKAIELDPKDAKAYATRAQAYWFRGELDFALADYSKVIELDPNDAFAYAGRAKTYSRKGEIELALADHAKVIELHPQFVATAHYNRGVLLKTKGDISGATKDFVKAIALEHKFTPAYVGLGVIYRDQGDTKRAIGEFTKAIKDPSEVAKSNRGLPATSGVMPERERLALAYGQRGMTYCIEGKLDLAITDLKEALELHPWGPNYVHWLYWIGVAKYDKGDFEGAAAAFSQHLEKKANGIRATLLLYLAKLQAGDGAKAQRDLEARASQLKSNAWPYPLVDLYLDKLTPTATLDGADIPSNRCEAQLFIGRWHVQKKETSKALDALKIVLETCPAGSQDHIEAAVEVNRLRSRP